MDTGKRQRRTPPRQARWTRYRQRTFYLFVSPWLIGFVLLTAAPLGYALWMSLTNFDGVSGRWRWVGTRNYVELLSDRNAVSSLVRTLAFTGIAVPLMVGGGLGLAVILNRRLKAVGLFRTIFFLPSVVPVVAAAIMWKLILNRDAGILNWILDLVGVTPIAWLADPHAIYALLFLTVWGLGGGMVIMLAALQTVPEELEEAAVVDGANRWHVFRHVTVPMISPVIFFQVVVGIIFSFQMVVQPLLLAPSSSVGAMTQVPQSLHLFMVQVYREYFFASRFGYGSAMLWVFFVVILLVTLAVLWSSRHWVHYQVEVDDNR